MDRRFAGNFMAREYVSIREEQPTIDAALEDRIGEVTGIPDSAP